MLEEWAGYDAYLGEYAPDSAGARLGFETAHQGRCHSSPLKSAEHIEMIEMSVRLETHEPGNF